jgi:ABC-type polysaccharide/polyol phosphate export permease
VRADTETVGVNRGFVLTSEPPTTRQLLRDVWRSRELVFMLSRKDFFVKFRRTSGGLIWSILLPIVQASVMAVVLSKVVRFDTGITYVVFIYSGQMVFNFLSNGVALGVGSVIDGSGLTTKIYFPRLVLPLVVVGGGFYALIPSIVVLLGFAVFLDADLGLNTLWLIPGLALLAVLTASLAAVLSVIQVYVRDLRYIVAAAQLPWQYLSPVFYPLVAVGRFRNWIEMNPATGVIEMVRASVGGADPDWGVAVAWSIGWSVLFAVIAIRLYRKYDRVVVDLL